jgi:hypothetical protein
MPMRNAPVSAVQCMQNRNRIAVHALYAGIASTIGKTAAVPQSFAIPPPGIPRLDTGLGDRKMLTPPVLFCKLIR